MAYIKKTTAFCVVFLALYAVFNNVEANECSYDYSCYGLQYCCDRKYPESNVCRHSCIGQSCIIDSDCAPGECCDSDDKCRSEGNCDLEGLAGWIVAIIVISIIVVIVIPIAVGIFCCCCAASASRRQAHAGVIVTQPIVTGTTVQYPTQQGQPMYYQPSPQAYQPPPPQLYQPPPPQGTVYPSAASGPPIAMTPQTEQKQ